jgi:MFS superfamily sulfate permease-like transporter
MGGLSIAMMTLCAGLIASAIFGRVPQALVVALLVLVVVRLAVSLVDTANRHLRRRDRRLRMRSRAAKPEPMEKAR